MGVRRFSNTGGTTTAISSSSSVKREPTKMRECHIINSKHFHTERYDDEISSTKVSLNQFPGLMLHGLSSNSETRRLLQINHDTGNFEEQEQYVLQVPHRHICRGSAYGWLFLTDDNLDMKLLNPFSGAEIQLPPVKTLPLKEKDCPDLSRWFVCKAVFSANPSIEPRPVVLVIYGRGDTLRLAFCKPGDQGWTHLDFPRIYHLTDAIYHEGQFYVLGWPGYVAAFDIGRRIDDDYHSVKTVVVAKNYPPKRRGGYMRDCYIVMLDGELVRFDLKTACMCETCFNKSIQKIWPRRSDGDTTDEEDDFTWPDVDYSNENFLYGGVDEIFQYEGVDDKIDDKVHLRWVRNRMPVITYKMKIYRFDASEKQWVKMESLGDKTVFLGYNTSFALSASDYPAGVCIPNSVYFTYGVGGNNSTEHRFYHTGIYNVKNKTLHGLWRDPFSFVKPAPIWIVNSADR